RSRDRAQNDYCDGERCASVDDQTCRPATQCAHMALCCSRILCSKSQRNPGNLCCASTSTGTEHDEVGAGRYLICGSVSKSLCRNRSTGGGADASTPTGCCESDGTSR